MTSNKILKARYDAYTELSQYIYELAEFNGGGYNMPKYPRATKDDLTFESTTTQGGYGQHTGGAYHLRPANSHSGYKPYGALGQGH